MPEIPETAKIKGKIIEDTLRARIEEKREQEKKSDEPPKRQRPPSPVIGR